MRTCKLDELLEQSVILSLEHVGPGRITGKAVFLWTHLRTY